MIELIKDNPKSNILIIDNSKEFNTKLASNLGAYNYTVSQAFDEQSTFKEVERLQDNLNFIILNIDFDDETTTEIFNYIIKNTDAKIILLSKEDIGLKREEYFKQGILDYHLTNKKTEHIVDDIVETIEALTQNKKETILIIDDSKLMCEMIKNVLQMRNYNVFVAYNSKDGLDIIKTMKSQY